MLLLALIATLVTPARAEEPVRIVAIGDTGIKLTDDPKKEKLASIAEHTLLQQTVNATEPDVILALGDLYYGFTIFPAGFERRLHAYWDGFDAPILPVIGNHERLNLQLMARLRAEASLREVFPTAPASDQRWLVYNYQQDDVCLMVGDSSKHPRIRVPDAPSSDCAWRIGVLHHAWATTWDKAGEQDAVREAVAPLSPDLVVSGHAHQLEMSREENVAAVVSGSGAKTRCTEAPVTLASGETVTVSCREGSEMKSVNAGVEPYYAIGQLGFTVIDVYGDRIEVRPHTVIGAVTAAEGCWSLSRDGSISVSCEATP